jgi:hypothetical protein
LNFEIYFLHFLQVIISSNETALKMETEPQPNQLSFFNSLFSQINVNVVLTDVSFIFHEEIIEKIKINLGTKLSTLEFCNIIVKHEE